MVPESAMAECLLVKVNELQDKAFFDKETCKFCLNIFYPTRVVKNDQVVPKNLYPCSKNKSNPYF